MLARAAAKRKVKHPSATFRHIAASFNQLYLPWLCPAQLRWISSTSLGPQSPSVDAVRFAQARPGPNRDSSRSLATATEFVNTNHDHIPFMSTRLSQPSPLQSQPPPLSYLKPWSPQSPIVIHDAIATAPPVLAKFVGIGGDSTELHQNLHACLAIGRFDRAQAIVQRLAHLFNPTAPELLEAHNLCLRSLVESLALGHQGVSLNRIQRWFEIEVRGADVQPDANTYALMCRAAMLSPEHSRDRAVRRYLHLAEEAGLLQATLLSGEYQDSEWQELVQTTPNFLRPPQLPHNLEAPTQSTAPENSSQKTAGERKMERLTVNAVEQKGLGLKTLNEALTALDTMETVSYPEHMEGTKEERDKEWGRLREIKLEESVVDAAIARWREEHAHMMNMGIAPRLRAKSMEALLWEWQTGLESVLKDELREIAQLLEDPKKHHGDSRLECGPFLESVKPERSAAIVILTAIHQTIRVGMREGVKIAPLASRIGSLLEAECAPRHEKYRKAMDSRKGALRRRSTLLNVPGPTQMAFWSHQGTADDCISQCTWPATVKIQLGALLLSKLVAVAKISVRKGEDEKGEPKFTKEPAFIHHMVHEKGKTYGMIKANPTLIQSLTKDPSRHAVGVHGQLPMLVEPLPWEGLQQGGYIRHPAPLMRSKGRDVVQRMYTEAAIEKGDMDQVFAGLDVLGKTAWRINNAVLSVMVEAWNSGKAIADIPAENAEITYPPEPDASAGVLARIKWKKAIQALENEKFGFHSQRCYQNLQLEVARAFSKETFYYPHNIDFRGRAYPIPPLLNHMGADNCRGLLTFAIGKPLGSTGLSWLKVHLANVFGYDKASLSEREQFAMDHIEDIYDSATNSLSGRKWWLEAEDPWQCLACCFELRMALESPNPTQFVSTLPVHQDGTCNGLQHYAALGGDALGAAQVNLEPGDRPADIYSGVANLVRAEISQEAEEGNEMARVLKDKITRKVVKQTVMTNVYGVTFVGARLQVQNKLDEIMPNMSESDVDNYVLSAYIAKKIFKALAAMFHGAHDIQYWLGACADRISTVITPEQIRQLKARREGKPIPKHHKYTAEALKYNERKLQTRISRAHVTEFKSSVIWTTPLKLPVVQPYRSGKAREVHTALQNISIREPRPDDPVSKRKQLQAFPPNFIHSLDATHMLLSAIKCDEIGLTFASVHDSFWTHAADVPAMNRVLRDAFVRMHSEDIIGRLAAEFRARYKDCMRLASIPSRSEVGKKILKYRRDRLKLRRSIKKSTQDKATRTGSTMADELLEEWERGRLLRSKIPEERRKGEDMETAGSIFQAAGDSSDLQLLSNEIAETQLGAIPAEAADGPDDTSSSVLKPTDAPSDMESSTPVSPEPGRKTAAKPTRKYEGKVLVWVPLTFPEVPEKGDFNVSRLKESTYFFS